MILFLAILIAAMLGTLGCIATLVYVIRRERTPAAPVVTDAAWLSKMLIEVTARAVSERAVNSLAAFSHSSRPDALARIDSTRQEYRPALA